MSRRALVAACSLLGAAVVVGATPSSASASSARFAPSGSPAAFTVDGEATPMREVVADLAALAHNDHLGVVTVNDEGDEVPVPDVVATWLTKAVYLEVAAAELERRGARVERGHLLLARRFERHEYGDAAWRALPSGFRTRQVRRTAAVVALADTEGIDLGQRGRTRRRVATLLGDLVRRAAVSVAPRFGTWNPQLAVVVPRADGPAS